ncbi:MAG: TRAP transporter small permease [Pseudomonadota bacterium]
MKLFRMLTTALAWVAALMLAATGVMLTYEVVARYFFTAPTIWAAELSQLFLIWASLIAMPWLLAARRHIAVDAAVGLLPPPARRVTETIAMTVVAAFAGVTAVYGGWIFYDSFERGRTSGTMLDLPAALTEAAMPLGMGLLAVQALIEIARAWGPEGVPAATHGSGE